MAAAEPSSSDMASPRAEVLAVTAAAFQRLGRALETLPTQLAPKCNCSAHVIAEVWIRIDESPRLAAVAGMSRVSCASRRGRNRKAAPQHSQIQLTGILQMRSQRQC